MKDSVKYIIASVLVFVLVFFLSFGIWAVCLINEEISLKQKIDAQQIATKTEFDNMKKKILQNSQVSDKYKNALIEVLTAYTEGRHVEGEQLMMKWSNEAVPTLSPDLYKQLSNIITSSRDKFTIEQQQLLDMQREYNILVQRFPNNLVFNATGKKPIEVIIITSTATENTYKSGKEDDLDL